MTALDVQDFGDALGPLPGPADADHNAHTAQIVRASGTSFAAGMRILPRDRRAAMYAIYAFCRTVDDIADGDLPVWRKLALLTAWRRELDRIHAGRPGSIIGRALVEAIARFDLPRDEFVRMLDGMEMDARGPIVAPTARELSDYIRCVAGSVGLLSMRAFGAWCGGPSIRFGLSLAEALQLTNILRDIEEDAGVGRLYLPAEALARAGIPASPAAAADPRLPAVCAELGARAFDCFAAARAEIGAHRRLNLAPALMMMGPYRGYLDMMAARGWQRGAPVRMGGRRKALLGLACILWPGR